MKARGVDSEYVDYMMGHALDTYHDVQSRGIEFLRNIFGKAARRSFQEPTSTSSTSPKRYYVA